MTCRILFTLCLLACLGRAQEPACQPIDSDRIYARDLAAAAPEFSRIPPTTLLASAPQPGSKRTLHATELMSLAQRYSITFSAPRDVCFEWAMQPLDRNLAIEAMRASLGIPDAKVEIAESSLQPVPRGRLEFPRERLGSPASPAQRDPVLWRGDVVYGGDHRYAVWARVRITATCRKFVAAESLKAGHPITAGQLRMETGECFPSPDRLAVTPDQIVGMLPTRPLAAGSEVRSALLSSPYDVSRGDLVDVEVRSGGARLKFTGRAESGGRLGDNISIRNPGSNKTFLARVSGKDKALVQMDWAEDK